MVAGFGSERLSPLEEAVVAGWVEQSMRVGGDVHWSWSVLTDLIRDAPERAWPLIREIVQRVPDHGLAVVGAGPLEDLLSCHGPKIIAAVEAEAARDPRFRRALAVAYQLDMSNEVFARVRAVADSADTLDDDEPGPFETHRVSLRVLGRPPGATDGPAEATAAIGRLTAALGEPNPARTPFTEPVALEIILELRPGTAPADPTAVIQAIVVALTGPSGAYANPSLVRAVEYRAMAAREDRYTVTAAMMSTGQAAAFDDPRELDEIVSDLDREE